MWKPTILLQIDPHTTQHVISIRSLPLFSCDRLLIAVLYAHSLTFCKRGQRTSWLFTVYITWQTGQLRFGHGKQNSGLVNFLPKSPLPFEQISSIYWKTATDRGYTTEFWTGALSSQVQPLTLYMPLFTEKVPHPCTLYWQMIPLPHTTLKGSIPFNCCKCTVF